MVLRDQNQLALYVRHGLVRYFLALSHGITHLLSGGTQELGLPRLRKILQISHPVYLFVGRDRIAHHLYRVLGCSVCSFCGLLSLLKHKKWSDLDVMKVDQNKLEYTYWTQQ